MKPGGWTSTSPHVGAVPRYQWWGLGSPSPPLLPGLLRARLIPKGSRGEISCLVGGKAFLEGIFGSPFWQPHHAGAMLNYSLHQLANLPPSQLILYPCCATSNHLSTKPCPETSTSRLYLRSIISFAHTSFYFLSFLLLNCLSSRGIITLYIGSG